MNVILTTLFGIEALTAEELIGLGYPREQLILSDGQVRLDPGTGPDAFSRAIQAVARLNIGVRTAERVLVELASFPAADFNALFDQTRALPWEDWIPTGAAFTVAGYSRKSALYGIPACQSLIKKAIVSRLLAVQGRSPDSQLAEDPAMGFLRIQFGIVADRVSMMVDTSGDGLHKRGYRRLRHEAPIKETLAAAMLMVSRFAPFSDEALVDPCCGSGTIPIEAALLACRLAPGLNRSFAGEKWPLIGESPFRLAREEAMAATDLKVPGQPFIFGSDLSEQAIKFAGTNAKRAGVEAFIGWKTADLKTLNKPRLTDWTGFSRHLVIGNPPYGERLLDLEQAEAIYRALGQNYLDRGLAAEGIRLSIITPHERFETLVGGRADKRRKLYNGMIRCTLFHYFKQRRNIS